jgi:SAM-dependent methyltransferase
MNLLSKHETRRRLLRGLPDSDLIHTRVNQWFQSPQGSAVLTAELEAVRPIVSRFFGYHILQIGCSEEHSLIAESPAGHKIIFSPSYRAGSTHAVANNEELPLANDSIDAVVLHHALDFTENSHKLLREATRVLRPGGQMLIIGFNPASHWGFWKLFKRKTLIPWRARFLSRRRLTDWLKLLDLHIDSVRFSLHFLPIKYSRCLKHAPRLERFGNRLRNPFGGAYIIVCLKQVVPLTPLLPRWRTLRARATVLPAAENVRAKIH